MKAITFKVRFLTAQFKEHTQKMTRRTYLIPPPSVVAGIFGAILGVERRNIFSFSETLFSGAELKSLGGRTVTFARIFKVDRPPSQLLDLLKKYYGGEREKVLKDVQQLLPIKESEELYMPEYKFAVASPNEEIIEEGLRRLREFDFEYDIFGGNDYHFVEFIDNPRLAKMEKSVKGYGYCPRKDFEGVEAETFCVVWELEKIREARLPLIMPATFLANVNEDFIQVYGARIIAKKELDVVNDGENAIFVYKVRPFLV